MYLTSKTRIADYEARGWWQGRSVDALFQQVGLTGGDELALCDPLNREALDGRPAERLSWAALHDRVERVAGSLLGAGLAKDDVVVAQLPNTVDAVALVLACARLGVIISPVVMQYRAHELGHIVGKTRPKAFVTVERFGGHDHAAMAAALGVRVLLAHELAAGDPAPVVDYVMAHPTEGGEVMTICWTSGTESAPKGVPRDHNHWILNAQVVAEAAGMADGDVILNPFPLVNIASIGGMMLPWLWLRGRMVLHHPFDLPLFLQQIAAERVTYTIAPPAVLTALLMQPAILAATDISSLRAIGSGSAPLSPFLIGGWRDKHGIEICNIFGSNEGCSLFCGPVDVPDPELRARYFVHTGQKGITGEVVHTRLVDAATEAEITAPGQVGELRLAGGNVFSGYWEDTELNARAFDDKGYFRTGDLFEIAGEGELARFYRFVGRSKEIIVRGGVNISPAEIDDLLVGAPDLLEAATVGIPDEVLGERVAVAVVPREGATPSIASLGAWLEGKGCAIFKRPERLVVVEKLPRNAMNKVVRDVLRAEVVKRMG
ncbi:acyl-CoA synthetase (AMP-forming)/AMP-acid ligase II [Polymorphobacter multimanifer]|uniref:Acyl-CoA synthetase (AMP-forming)/AMP-acid ligase II n=1 Tax=Polymorphobacter multimanifer TaxID=1070431 RepID=A0A841L4V0_9SPHN|nr:class I adenylate-forming enzyme family protein [Polymorphobacter multimanifer]MBB6227889.1 acyl-CoA synthetase (AMP-forming)/AMP-acid ligase II [Polymorphobacter multimanifer]